MMSYTEDARESELVRLMEQYGDSIKRMCCVYLRDLGAAEDAAQETFIKAFEHIDQLLGGGVRSEKAWLTRIAINTCKDMLRSSWMRHIDRRQAIEELPLSVMPRHEDSIALTQAVMALPPKLREIVLLYYYQDMNLRACAEALDISAPTATRRLQQAQARLKAELKHIEGGANR
ncbi:MAG: sigma-70 family RNA polymerase sigma factor [Clostridia bacterium]|nr:sigma-70 family RNA polymerase sigma factor [Clostridia bacterium]